MALKKLFGALLFFLSITTANASSDQVAFLRGGYAPVSFTPGSFTPAWQSAKICCGGLMNNIQSSSSDGTLVASTNTLGAYLYKPTGTCSGQSSSGFGTNYTAPCWEQLVTAVSVTPSLALSNALNFGVLEIAACNNNTSDAYMFFNGNLWVTTTLKSAAASRRWAQTPLTNSISGNQGINAGTGSTIACDPANSNVVYAATPSGVSVSANGLSGASATFATISTAKIGTTGAIPSAIAFDPASSTGTCSAISGSPTCSLHFWILTDGTGVYETYNGGTSFTLTTGGPTTASNACANPYCMRMKSDKFSQLWVAIGDANLYKYIPNGTAGGGTWSHSTPGVLSSQVSSFGIDPTASSAGTERIAAGAVGGSFALSTNGAGSWTGASVNPFASTAPEPGWINNANQNQGSSGQFMDTQDMEFDTSGNLWNIAGIGAWQVASANVAIGATWQITSLGIEQLVATHVISCSGISPVVGVWDRGFFLLQNPDVFPTHYWPDETYSTSFGQIQGGWAHNCAASNPTFFTGYASDNDHVPASSSDGGNTWTSWPNIPPTANNGGAIAVSTPTNWVVVPSGDCCFGGGTGSGLYYTTNAAATAWTAATISGATTPYNHQIGQGTPMAADSVTANAFCLIDSGNNIFSSVNGGANWTKVNSGVLSAIKYNDALKAVPGVAGTFYYSGGNAGGGATGSTFYKITKTTNECDTATVVNSNIVNIYGFGYGAPVPGGNGFPTIYMWATVSGVLGLYELDNGGTTPTLISAPAAAQVWTNNSVDFVLDVSGDVNVYGRVYVGYSGSGFAYLDNTNACPWVNFSNTNPNASLTGTVSLQAQSSGLVPVTAVDFYVDGTLIGRQTTPSGTVPTYTQSWVTGGVANGAHTLKVLAEGSTNALCTTSLASGNSFSIPITTH